MTVYELKFWMKIYEAAIRAGNGSLAAKAKADEAVDHRRECTP